MCVRRDQNVRNQVGEVSSGSESERKERVVLMVGNFRVRKKPDTMETPSNPQGQHQLKFLSIVQMVPKLAIIEGTIFGFLFVWLVSRQGFL